MRQGTTPAYLVKVVGWDLTDKTVLVTLRDVRKEEVTKTGSDLTVTFDGENSLIAFKLSQEDTFALHVGKVELQVRFIGSNGNAYATDVVKVDQRNVLLKKVIRYDGGD